MPSVRSVLKKARVAVDTCRHVVHWHEPESKIIRDAQAYWEAPPAGKGELFAHWRDGFSDPEAWSALGRQHLGFFDQFARSAKFPRPARKVVEWGCGGGANAVHFGREAEAFYGIDITRASLDECARQMAAAGLSCFHPVLVQSASPEAALDAVPHDCDLFTCFYVFEVFPTPEYGVRILQIAHRMLRPGGMAIIQIKYPVGFSTQSRRWGYRWGMASMTTYRIHEFWEHARACGFETHAVKVMPKQPLVQDGRYAYFILLKAE